MPHTIPPRATKFPNPARLGGIARFNTFGIIIQTEKTPDWGDPEWGRGYF